MKPQPSATKPSPVRAVALLGLLTALCTVLRIVKVPIPNVQPVTDILMIVHAVVPGLSLGLQFDHEHLDRVQFISWLWDSGHCRRLLLMRAAW